MVKGVVKVKYKCFCEKDFFDLTRTEVQQMLRGNKRINPEDFVKHYNITPDMYKEMIHAKGLQSTWQERAMYTRYNDEKRKKENANSKINNFAWNPMEIGQIPKFLVCALYDVDFEDKDGKRYYDIEQFEKARNDIENKIESYIRKFQAKKDNTEYSKLTHIDLVAMRIFRGFNRKKFAKESALSIEMIKEYESKGSKIPSQIEKLYKRILGVKDRHIIQLRDIMNGKSKEIVDDRMIPKIIKLKVWRRDKGKCSHCGSREKLHYHHIQHYAEGGMHTEENLTLLCATCHAEEHKGERAYHMLKKIAEQ